MQKRARAVESQKLRRTMKGRTRALDAVREGVGAPLAYARLACVWLCVVLVDALVGFRFEFLWPFWLLVRAGYEAVHKNSNQMVALAQPQSTKFSVFFVCVTATSDLICFLFIPVRVLIFLASTYVWMHLLCHTNGGFLRTISLVLDRTQGLPVVLLWLVFLLVEVSCRLRCDYLVLTNSGGPLHYLNLPHGGCTQMQGLAPPVAHTLNAFFGAHCIGYPIVIVSFSLRYYYREWSNRRTQEDVSRRNESYFKVLTEALPAVYEGPKDYSNNSGGVDESLDYEYGTSDLPLAPLPLPASTLPLPSSAPPPPRKQSIKNDFKNGGAKSSRSNNNNNNLRSRKGAQKGAPESQTSTPETKISRAGTDELNDEDAHVPSRGFVIVRLIAEALSWLTNALTSSSPARHSGSPRGVPRGDEDFDDDDDGEEQDDENSELEEDEDWRRKNRPKPPPAAPPTTTVQKTQQQPNRGRGGRANAVRQPPAEVHQNGNSTARPTSTRSSSAAASEKANGDTANGRVESREDPVETDAVRLRQAKALADDLRLQLSVWQNNEKMAKQEASQLRSRCEQLEAKLANVQKARDGDRAQQQALERKYAELLNKKNDVERDLIAERKARKEEANNRHRVATADALLEEHREKERAWEREVESLRSEVRARDELVEAVESELSALRAYKEQNDIENLQMEIRIMKEKNGHLEDSLAAENRLKLDLFRALGDAKANNEQLQASLRQREAECRRLASVLPTAALAPNDIEEKASPSGSSSSQGTNNFAPLGASITPPPATLLSKSETNGLLHMANSFQPYSFSTQEQRLYDPDSIITSENLLRFSAPQATLK